MVNSFIGSVCRYSVAAFVCLHSPAIGGNLALNCGGSANASLFAGPDYHPPKGAEIPAVSWELDEGTFRARGGVFRASHPFEFHALIAEHAIVVDAEGYGGVFERDDGDGSSDTADFTSHASDLEITESGYMAWLHTRYPFDSDYGARPMTLAVFKVDRETGAFEFRGLRQQGDGEFGPLFGVEGGTAERFDMVVNGFCEGFPGIY